MIKVPFVAGLLVDPLTEKIIITIRDRIVEKDDDGLLFCVGTPGSGKSSLMMHAYTIYDPDRITVDCIGLSQQEHAVALDYSAHMSLPRFCCYDEANVSKRDAMTQKNKDIIDLYYSNRGDNTLHWWNNPSAEILDKVFIEDRIKGLIIIHERLPNFRTFYYYTKQGLLDLLSDGHKLTERSLVRNAKKYAHHRGWFKKYEGGIYPEYLAKKKAHMNNKRQSYIDKYGMGELFSQTDVSRQLGVSAPTIQKWHEKLEGLGVLVQDKHFVRNAAGHRKYYELGVDVLRNHSFDDVNLGGGGLES